MNRIVTIIILLAVAITVLETEPLIRSRNTEFFRIAEIIFGFLFTIEYGLRLWAAGENDKYKGFIGRIKFILSIESLIDLFAILPFLITFGFENTFLFRLFRLLRLFALAKLGRYSSALRNIYRALHARRYELLMSLLAGFIVMLLAAAALYFTEGRSNAENFGSIPRALWWGVATLTKVGYGGAYPATVLGKLFAAVFAIAGVAVIAMPTGILAAAFSDAFQQERKNRGTTVKMD